MAIKKIHELREMDEEELKEQLTQLKNDLAQEESSIASGTQADNPGKIKEIKRTIARILTVLNERGALD